MIPSILRVLLSLALAFMALLLFMVFIFGMCELTFYLYETYGVNGPMGLFFGAIFIGAFIGGMSILKPEENK